jgi:hypothetical protein
MKKATPPKSDRRLLGSWRSDRLRTLRHYKHGPKSPSASRRRFKSIFGKLVVRWTRKFVYTEFERPVERQAYEIVARNASSVVVRFADGELMHIHFEDDWYWIGVHGVMCEYFKRIK